jgi:thioredoxin 1
MQNWTPEELQEKLGQGGGVFLKLWKKGCGACKLSVPAIERLEAANTHGLEFGQVNSDDHPEILEITGTEVLPAFFVFKGGEMKGSLVGFKGLEKLKTMIDDAMKG